MHTRAGPTRLFLTLSVPPMKKLPSHTSGTPTHFWRDPRSENRGTKGFAVPALLPYYLRESSLLSSPQTPLFCP